MELSGHVLLASIPSDVWSALFDPEILKRCIPGCKAVERTSDSAYVATMAVKVGPLNASFSGSIALVDPEYPTAVTLSGALQSGAAGFAKGQARITLRPVENATELHYLAEMRIGGKLAAVGDRLFGSAVKRNITDFFAAFEAQLAGGTTTESTSVSTPSAASNLI
jgi:carbon monoxide dehydrogenase subunit G